jgi:hypothetical protein
MKLGRTTLTPALLAAALLAAGCGGAASPGSPGATPSAESLAQILPAMQAAVDSAQSVHVSGTATSGSQSATIDMSLAAPSAASGSVTFQGVTLTLLLVSGNAYFQITSGFLQFAKVSPPDCGTLCGKYVEVPASETSQFASDVSIQSIFKQAFASIPSSARHNTADIFEPTTYDGQPALKASIAGNTLVVAQGAKPYVLAASNAKGVNLVFSEWNAVPPITAPPASDVVSLSGL